MNANDVRGDRLPSRKRARASEIALSQIRAPLPQRVPSQLNLIIDDKFVKSAQILSRQCC